MVAKRAGTAADERRRLRPIGVIRSRLKARSNAPRQGDEGAPDAWLDVRPSLADGLSGITTGARIIVLTWLHQARRDILQVYPRDDRRRPLTGVFATRSPDRPNPLGLHPVTVKRIAGNRLRIGPIEAIDGTPVVDIKPALGRGKR
jgi:tRNA-Thr(GGU) m(6)t(6)A37 methyltransferase TsaA